MTLKTYDVTWYWVGGAERGEWREAAAGSEAALRRMGYVAHPGRRSVGAPEGAPSARELSAVLGGER